MLPRRGERILAALRSVSKYFPENGVQALSNADLEIRGGEIHALVGENGAGKSTLLSVLAGSLAPSAGHVETAGEPAVFKSPADALRAGIGLVRQNPTLVPGLRVWEDCILGAEPVRGGFFFGSALRSDEARSGLLELARRWDLALDVDAAVAELALSQRQKAALLALLYRGVSVLALDEPTAALAPPEVVALFSLLKILRDRGAAVILVTHKLDEALSIADRVTVLRKGRTVASLPAAETDGELLSGLMFSDRSGRDAGAPGSSRDPGPKELRPADRGLGGGEDRAAEGPDGLRPGNTSSGSDSRAIGDRTEAEARGKDLPALALRDLRVHAPGRIPLRGIDLVVARSSIVGVAGVRESGVETLELAVAGMAREASGRIELCGVPMVFGDPSGFRAAGGAYLPGDRMGLALAPRRPLVDSLDVYERLGGNRHGPLGFLDNRASLKRARRIMDAAGVRGDPRSPAAAFSGGSLQRLLLEREFSRRPAFMLLSEPSWGLDLEGQRALWSRIGNYARQGGAALVISADIDELLDLCDSIVVLRDGSVSDRIDDTKRASEEEKDRMKQRLGAAMTGGSAA